MKTSFVKILLLNLACLSGAWSAAAGQPATNTESVKLVADGKTFLKNGQMNEALWAFRQSAKAGNAEGAFAAGDLLLTQAKNSQGRERILKSSEGLRFIFVAATNRNAQACIEMSEALQTGTGVQTNLIAAYAWLKLAGQFSPGLKPNLDRLVVLLEPGEVREAQDLEHEYQLGHWPANLVRTIDEGDPRLRIQGITVSSRGALVVLNNATLAPGDTDEVYPANSSNHSAASKLTITCREAGADYVLVAIAGEAHLKLLSTDQLARY